VLFLIIFPRQIAFLNNFNKKIIRINSLQIRFPFHELLSRSFLVPDLSRLDGYARLENMTPFQALLNF
jgi:hypothetical protein